MDNTGKSQALRQGSHPLTNSMGKLWGQEITMARRRSSTEGMGTSSRRRMADSRQDITNTQLRPPLNMRLSSLSLATAATRSTSGSPGGQETQEGK